MVLLFSTPSWMWPLAKRTVYRILVLGLGLVGAMHTWAQEVKPTYVKLKTKGDQLTLLRLYQAYDETPVVLKRKKPFDEPQQHWVLFGEAGGEASIAVGDSARGTAEIAQRRYRMQIGAADSCLIFAPADTFLVCRFIQTPNSNEEEFEFYQQYRVQGGQANAIRHDLLFQLVTTSQPSRAFRYQMSADLPTLSSTQWQAGILATLWAAACVYGTMP